MREPRSALLLLLLLFLLLLLLNLSGGQSSSGGVSSGGGGVEGQPRPVCDGCDERLVCNCSSRRLRRVPRVPPSVLALDLSLNAIDAVADDDLAPYGLLRRLCLRGNRVRSVGARAFRALRVLERLDLSENLLERLDGDWFSGLESLTHLDLLGNPYRSLGPVPLFGGLLRLRVLRLGGPRLEELCLRDLAGVGQLDHLELHANGLRRYAPGALSRAWPLGAVTLGLAGPFLSDAALAERVLADVSYPETPLTLLDLELSANDSVRPFGAVARRRVRSLTFRNVTLTDRAAAAFLEVTDGAPLAFLGFRDVRFVGVGELGRARLTRHENLDEFYVRNVELVNVFQFSGLLSMAFLLKYPRRVSVIGTKVFVMPCITSHLLRSLQYLDLSENLLSDMTLAESLCRGARTLPDLRVLNVSFNALKSLGAVSHLVAGLGKLTHLDVSGNAFSSMPAAGCAWPDTLRFLNLSWAKLRSVTPCLPVTLEVLDLSHNDLRGVALSFPSLRRLLLSGNKLLLLPPGSSFPSLELLSLQSNALSAFTARDLRPFPRLRALEAGGNKFHCSCEFVAFLAPELASGGAGGVSGVRLTDGAERYVCDSPLGVRGERVGAVRLSVVDCHRLAFVSALCGASLVLAAALAALLWRLHAVWYLRMTWAWLRAKRNAAAKRRRRRQRRHLLDDGDPDDDEGRFAYDAFVSYSEKDAGWVTDFLVPELERENEENGEAPPLALCLHQRDFLPGPWIVDNILHAMESSRRTLFVLSRHFVHSDWCRYELEFSHLRLWDGEEEAAAVLVLLEPLGGGEGEGGAAEVPRRFCRLRKMMSSRTYLSWPRDEERRGEFWDSLRAALRGG